MKHSYPTSEALKFLLQMAHNREMALPDFQRDFVWDPFATDELIESIISNYPAGCPPSDKKRTIRDNTDKFIYRQHKESNASQQR